MNKKYLHSKEDYETAAKNSKTISEMCRQLGIVSAGGNFGTIKRKIAEYNIDISHFENRFALPNIKYSDAPVCKAAIKKKLIRDRGYQCESCKNSEWLNQPIALELEHIDGDTSNDVNENLLLLCPNCHAQTKTWRRKKVQEGVTLYYCACGNTKTKKAIQCMKCFLIEKYSKTAPHMIK